MSKWNPNDHLPECGVTRYPICICDRLRACEQRVREEERALICVEQTALAELNAEYRKGVQAARDAVAADMDAAINVCGECTDVALAAIDALRGES